MTPRQKRKKANEEHNIKTAKETKKRLADEAEINKDGV